MRASVRRYLIASFAVCLIGVAGLAAFDSHSAFDRERAHAKTELKSAAQQTAEFYDDTSVNSLLQGMVGGPGLASGTTAQCSDALASLSSVTETAHLHILRADGTE